MTDKPEIVYGNKSLVNNNYLTWLRNLKSRFRQSQIKAAIRVNTTLLDFYWSLGHDIVAMRAEQTYGSNFFNQLSLDLKETFPNESGFSVTNIKYMKRWYLFYNQQGTICHQVGNESLSNIEIQMPSQFGEVPWRHHVEIFTHCKTTQEALFYIHKTIAEGWSRSQLQNQISSKLFERQGAAITNFNETLPLPQGQLAQEILKSPYNFEFLSLQSNYEERQLEDALINNISRFLLELGKGFAFVEWSMRGIERPLGVATYEIEKIVENTCKQLENLQK